MGDVLHPDLLCKLAKTDKNPLISSQILRLFNQTFNYLRTKNRKTTYNRYKE
jgi:hypothetical protein